MELSGKNPPYAVKSLSLSMALLFIGIAVQHDKSIKNATPK